MSRENLEVVRGSMRAWGRGDLDAALEAYDPDVVFDARMRPEGTIYRGREGVVEGMRAWTDTWDDWRVEVVELIDAGDVVIVHARESGRGKASGVQIEHEVFVLFTLRHGSIVRWEAFLDRDVALSVAARDIPD